MIVYRHKTEVIPPDLADWEPRESDAARVSQFAGDYQHVAIADPVLWRIPPGVFVKLDGGWEAALARNKGGAVPSRDLSRLKCWAPVLPVLDATGEQWMAPVILTPAGHRAFPVSYAGPDFLPAPTEDQQRAEAIAREIRATAEKERDGGEGFNPQIACRWSAVLLSITSHVSPAVIAALGILDDTLVRAVLLAAAGLDRRLDAV